MLRLCNAEDKSIAVLSSWRSLRLGASRFWLRPKAALGDSCETRCARQKSQPLGIVRDIGPETRLGLHSFDFCRRRQTKPISGVPPAARRGPTVPNKANLASGDARPTKSHRAKPICRGVSSLKCQGNMGTEHSSGQRVSPGLESGAFVQTKPICTATDRD